MRATILSCEYLMSPASASGDDVVEHIQSLIELNRLMGSGMLSPILESNLLDKLISRDMYPSESVFKRNIDKFGVEEYSARDVAKTINAILSRALTCDAEIPARELEWRDRLFDPPFCELEPGRQSELHGLLEGAATANNIESYELSLLFYCNKNTFNKISLTGYITDSYPDLKVGLPYYLEESIEIYGSYRKYLSSLDYYEIFDEVTGPEGWRFSLYVGALRKLKQLGKPVSTVLYDQIHIGSKFWDSLKLNQGLPGQGFARTTLDAAIDVLVSYKDKEPKIFETAAGSGRGRIKGNCRACREHVTKFGVGLRLMFWIDSENNIEFSNVGPKQELKIYDPDFIR